MKILYRLLCLIEITTMTIIGILAFIVIAGDPIGDYTMEMVLTKIFSMFTLYAIYKIEFEE